MTRKKIVATPEPERQPGKCNLCGAPALRYVGGIPDSKRGRMLTDWYHAGGTGECIVISRGSYLLPKTLTEAFVPTPGVEVIQYEIRYLDMSLGNLAYRPSGGAGSMVIGDDLEMAKRNADGSTGGHNSAYVYRITNGERDPKMIYAGKRKD
jgi:hypothetical protein